MEKDRYAKLDAKIKEWKESGLSPKEIDQKRKKDNPLDLIDEDGSLVFYRNGCMPKSKKAKKKRLVQNRKVFEYHEKDDIDEKLRRENHRLNQMVRDEKWYKIYLDAVEAFKSKDRQYVKGLSIYHRLYTEEHHIIPKSMGGSNNKSNLVRVSFEEHNTLHVLLCKAYPCNDAMYCAVMKRFYGRTQKERTEFWEHYDTIIRGEKIDELLREMIAEDVIDAEICNIN